VKRAGVGVDTRELDDELDGSAEVSGANNNRVRMRRKGGNASKVAC
jgi:hypothetical protein